jgi:Arc/MetJ family transcription regulator
VSDHREPDAQRRDDPARRRAAHAASLKHDDREEGAADFAISKHFLRYPFGISTATRHKTSFEIDTAKVAAAKDILGTKTLTDTVDAALSEVVKLRQRRELLKLLSTPGALQLDDPDVMAGAWR